MFQDEEELVLPLRPQKSPLNGLCCLTFGLVVFMAGLVLASIYVYRYYFIPHVRVQVIVLLVIVTVLLLDLHSNVGFWCVYRPDAGQEHVSVQGSL